MGNIGVRDAALLGGESLQRFGISREAACNAVRVRPAPVAAGDVYMTGVTKVDYARTPDAGIFARLIPRHVRIIAACHHDRGKRQLLARHHAKINPPRVTPLRGFQI